MKRPLPFAFTLIFIAAAAACLTQGVSPLYTPETRVVDDSIVGRWVGLDDGKPTGPRIEIERVIDDGVASYFATVTEKGKTDKQLFRLVLVELGGVRYVDALREPVFTTSEAREYRGWSMPVHQYGRLQKVGDHIVFAMLGEDWMKTPGVPVTTSAVLTERGPTSTLGSTLHIVTADTPTLQKLVQAAPATAFSATLELAPDTSKKAPKLKLADLVTSLPDRAPAACGCFVWQGTKALADGTLVFQEGSTVTGAFRDIKVGGVVVPLKADVVPGIDKLHSLKKGDLFKEQFSALKGGQTKVTASWLVTDVVSPAEESARGVKFDVQLEVTSQGKTQTVQAVGSCGC